MVDYVIYDEPTNTYYYYDKDDNLVDVYVVGW